MGSKFAEKEIKEAVEKTFEICHFGAERRRAPEPRPLRKRGSKVQ